MWAYPTSVSVKKKKKKGHGVKTVVMVLMFTLLSCLIWCHHCWPWTVQTTEVKGHRCRVNNPHLCLHTENQPIRSELSARLSTPPHGLLLVSPLSDDAHQRQFVVRPPHRFNFSLGAEFRSDSVCVFVGFTWIQEKQFLLKWFCGFTTNYCWEVYRDLPIYVFTVLNIFTVVLVWPTGGRCHSFSISRRRFVVLRPRRCVCVPPLSLAQEVGLSIFSCLCFLFLHSNSYR